MIDYSIQNNKVQELKKGNINEFIKYFESILELHNTTSQRAQIIIRLSRIYFVFA